MPSNKPVSYTQRSAMVYLFNRPQKSGKLNRHVGRALCAKGYAVRHNSIMSDWFTLTQAGIRYNQTGKLIGE